MDFGQYIDDHKGGFVGERGGDHYAFSGDLKMQKRMRNLRPLELAVASTVRLGKGVLAGDLMGSAVQVSARQFPKVYGMVRHCANTLGIPMPQVFIQGRIDSVNAMAAGTDRDAVIVIHSVTLEHLSEDELLFVLGHECGHIQNGHMVYLTTLRILTEFAGVVLRGFVQPALMALQSWSRAAEITCDRAGLLCCKDEVVGEHAFLKLAIGSPKLYKELNVPEYLDQLRQGHGGLGSAAEMTKSHPYIPKRIESLKLFAQSEVYRKACGLSGGLTIEEVDRRVEEVVKVF